MTISSYVTNYVKGALQCPEIDAPEQSQSGDYYEVLVSLYQANLVGGTEGAQIAWSKLVEFAPELAQSLRNASKRRLHTISDLKNLPPLEWIMNGMIPKRAVCEIHGAPGSGKSLF